jgi:uncharacterized membrane protein YkgB
MPLIQIATLPIGITASDSSGTFGLAFTPEVPGMYKIVATFAGSKSYWDSFAETFIYVEETPANNPEPKPSPTSIADIYLVPGIIGITVAIVVIGVILMLMLRKR